MLRIVPMAYGRVPFLYYCFSFRLGPCIFSVGIGNLESVWLMKLST